jgi:hypothetical protein
MQKQRLVVALSLVGVLGLFAGGCGGDDDEDGDGGGSTPSIGTCDLSGVSQSCIEVHDASAADLENQENGCLDAGGVWTNLECPTEDLVGCCDYEFGNTFHECFYTGIARDPVAYCADTVDGVWTPAI